ncbi:hypothetical protein OSTOST_07935, partial [Ostertagia ostertagi]
MEEEMLSSHGSQKRPEVFERVEHDEPDDITYAPEIQVKAKLRELKPISAQQAARAQAPHIVSANRANSNSSLASGRSGRSSSEGFPK